MAFDEKVAARVRAVLKGKRGVEEKKMFGGIAFMVRGHMCVGVNDDALMARVGPDAYEKTLKLAHAREMDFTGKPLKGFIWVGPKGFATKPALEKWVGRCLDFNKTLKAK